MSYPTNFPIQQEINYIIPQFTLYVNCGITLLFFQYFYIYIPLLLHIYYILKESFIFLNDSGYLKSIFNKYIITSLFLLWLDLYIV